MRYFRSDEETKGAFEEKLTQLVPMSSILEWLEHVCTKSILLEGNYTEQKS